MMTPSVLGILPKKGDFLCLLVHFDGNENFAKISSNGQNNPLQKISLQQSEGLSFDVSLIDIGFFQGFVNSLVRKPNP